VNDHDPTDIDPRRGDGEIAGPRRRFTLEKLFRGKTPAEWRAAYAGAFDWGPDIGREAIGE
jgi:hypothetical protein